MGVCEGEVEVGKPVVEADGAAEGEDYQGVGGVGGEVAGYVCGGVGSEGCSLVRGLGWGSGVGGLLDLLYSSVVDAFALSTRGQFPEPHFMGVLAAV